MVKKEKQMRSLKLGFENQAHHNKLQYISMN